MSLEDGGVSAVPLYLRRDDGGGGDVDGRTMVSRTLLCLTDAQDGVVLESSPSRPPVAGLLLSDSMVGGSKNDGTDG